MTINDWYEAEVAHYWSLPTTLSPSEKREKIEMKISTEPYMFSLKTDGVFSRAIINGEHSVLQSRGISKKTGTYGEYQEHLFWWDDVIENLPDQTVILGEVFLPNGIDKNVGSIVRSLPFRAKCIQSKEFYMNASKEGHKFTKKDIRDIESNPFFNTPLHWRIFDVLMWSGQDLCDEGIEVRSQYIERAVRAINNPYVKGVKYSKADPETFFDIVSDMLAKGQEGCVLYREGAPYRPGKRTAWETIKVKQFIENEIDCFISGFEPAVQAYTGKEPESWNLWVNLKTGEFLEGQYYGEYTRGELNIIPVSKGYWNGWCGAIYCSVLDKEGKEIQICKVSGLTDEIKEAIKQNKDSFLGRALTISGMMISTDKDGNLSSVRHPVIKTWRDDLNKTDCTLAKIIGQL